MPVSHFIDNTSTKGNNDTDILVVDDMTANLQVLVGILHQAGLQARAAINGKLALQSIAVRKPNLILLDIQMPGMDGFEFCRKLKEDEETRNIPVIFISALSDTHEKVKAFETGGVDYIVKPFQAAEVLARVETQLRLQNHDEEMRIQINLLNEYKLAMDSGSIVCKTDTNGIITDTNSEFENTFGYMRDELIGQDIKQILSSNISANLFRQLWVTVNDGEVWKGLIHSLTKTGEAVYLDYTAVPIRDGRGGIREHIMTSHNVTSLIKQEELIREQTTDSVTGLPNRIKLMQALEVNPQHYMTMFDLDEFRAINDFYGLECGDQVLHETGVRMLNLSKGKAEVYRVGGDKFVICSIVDMSAETFTTLSLDIINALSEKTFYCDDEEINISVTAGISELSETCYLQSDLALTRAKHEQKQYLVYHASMEKAAQYKENIRWAHNLKSALLDDRVIPYYQPIVDNQTGAIVKHEALVRMITEDNEVISPFYFLEVSRRSHQYAALTKAVTRHAIDSLQKICGSISINLAVRDIRDHDTTDFLYEFIKYPEIGSRVVFEITETQGIENFSEVAEFIERVKSYGCKISIDDFGTGYSNLVYLIQLKADYLKIDGSITRNLLDDPNAVAVTRFIVSAAKSLKMETIAEFVSSEAIYHKVRKLGVDYSQGYYFGKPEPEPIQHIDIDIAQMFKETASA